MNNTALLIIDIQQDYFPGGAMELYEPVAAAQNASRLLAAARTHSIPVFHVQQRTPPEFALPLLVRGTEGEQIHPLVAPNAQETLIEKTFPSSFQGTQLEEQLRAAGIEHLVVCGMMTHVCVASTVHSAFERGLRVTLVYDATATRALSMAGQVLDAELVGCAHIAALDGTFARVVSTADWIEEQGRGH